MTQSTTRSAAEIEARLAQLQEQYSRLKLEGSMDMVFAQGAAGPVEAQLLVLAGGIMLCQWMLGRKIDPPIELVRAGWTPPKGFSF